MDYDFITMFNIRMMLATCLCFKNVHQLSLKISKHIYTRIKSYRSGTKWDDICKHKQKSALNLTENLKLMCLKLICILKSCGDLSKI